VSSIQSPWAETPGSSDVASRYVNSTDIAFTQYDMTFDFQIVTAEKVAPTGEPQFLAQRVVRIVMSPTHAKVLAEMIRNAVSQWEGRFGELPDVASLTPGLPSAPENRAGE
jgi:Protein of unknown function (DUF3467)